MTKQLTSQQSAAMEYVRANGGFVTIPFRGGGAVRFDVARRLANAGLLVWSRTNVGDLFTLAAKE